MNVLEREKGGRGREGEREGEGDQRQSALIFPQCGINELVSQGLTSAVQKYSELAISV